MEKDKKNGTCPDTSGRLLHSKTLVRETIHTGARGERKIGSLAHKTGSARRAGVGMALAVASCVAAIGCASSGGSSGIAGGEPSLKERLVSDASVKTGTFENGLSWSILRNGEPRDRIMLRLAVNAGSVLEDDDQRGVAHLVEHMAFNGSENFAKNELIDYFESIGMKFGPEVNAYTSFDETVYMLEIPADDPAILDTSLLVLRDWASGLSFDGAELDKERGVVVEEWRLGRGAQGRANDAEFPFILKGSKYAERLPIGSPEIVKSVSRERVVDFYERWYRPDLMSVTVVGDADPDAILLALESSVGTIPKAKGKPSRPVIDGLKASKPGVLVFRDPEIQYITAEILEASPARPLKTVGDYRRAVVRSIAEAAFNTRLQEKTLVAEPLILGAGAGSQRLARPSDFAYLAAVPQPGRFEDGFKELLEEWLRYREFGITAAELERAKNDILDSAKQKWLDREKTHSASLAAELVNERLYGDVKISADDEYGLLSALVPGISEADVNAAIREWFADRGTSLLITAPDTAGDIPDEVGLLALWQKWAPEKALAAYAENGLDRPLFDSSLAAADTDVLQAIVSEKKLTERGLTEWKLRNGATVLAMPTDFKDNEILFGAWSKGGNSTVSDEDFPSAAISTSYARMSGLNGFSATDLQKKLSGMTVGAAPWIDVSYEGLSGSSSTKDLETALQLANLWFNRPYFTAEAWGALRAQLETVAASRGKDPAEAFADLKARLLYGDDVRHANLSPALVAKMDPEASEKAYARRFADAGDFTFVFVGSFRLDELKTLVATYLSPLPSTGSAENAVARPVPFPAGISSEVLKLGIDPKSRVFMAFGGPTTVSGADRELYGYLCSLLEIRLREIIREDMSGSYGVSVRGTMVDYPESFYETDIEFGCEPGREDELSAATLEQIRWMKASPVPETYVTKLRETWKRTQEEGLHNNGYWLRKLLGFGMSGRAYGDIEDVNAVLSGLTGENLSVLANRYFNEGNYVKAYLKPEK